MAIVGAFDVHRAQITYDYLDGEIRRMPASEERGDMVKGHRKGADTAEQQWVARTEPRLERRVELLPSRPGLSQELRRHGRGGGRCCAHIAPPRRHRDPIQADSGGHGWGRASRSSPIRSRGPGWVAPSWLQAGNPWATSGSGCSSPEASSEIRPPPASVRVSAWVAPVPRASQSAQAC